MEEGQTSRPYVQHFVVQITLPVEVAHKFLGIGGPCNPLKESQPLSLVKDIKLVPQDFLSLRRCTRHHVITLYILVCTSSISDFLPQIFFYEDLDQKGNIYVSHYNSARALTFCT